MHFIGSCSASLLCALLNMSHAALSEPIDLTTKNNIKESYDFMRKNINQFMERSKTSFCVPLKEYFADSKSLHKRSYYKQVIINFYRCVERDLEQMLKEITKSMFNFKLSEFHNESDILSFFYFDKRMADIKTLGYSMSNQRYVAILSLKTHLKNTGGTIPFFINLLTYIKSVLTDLTVPSLIDISHEENSTQQDRSKPNYAKRSRHDSIQ